MYEGNGNGNGHFSQAGSSTGPAIFSGPKEPEGDDNADSDEVLRRISEKMRPYFEKPVIHLTDDQAEFFHILGGANGKEVEAPGDLAVGLPQNCPCYVHLGDRGIAAVHNGNGRFNRVPKPPAQNPLRITPRNEEQAFAAHLLADLRIKCLILHGPAGVGKSLMVLAHIVQCIDRYDSVILVKQPCSIGEKEGFLPGYEVEKFDPHAQSFRDNLKLLAGNNQRLFEYLNSDAQKANDLGRKLLTSSLGKFRGRKFHNALVVLDEMQNTTYEEAYAVATRAAEEDSRFIGMGDLDQIDYAPARRLPWNGLYSFLCDTQRSPLCAQVGMIQNEQSRLCAFLTKQLAARHRLLGVRQ
jgi:predicted ribonuclease YlaK